MNITTENHGLEWLGKNYARLLATEPTNTLLKTDDVHNNKPENIKSENLLVNGDSLEVLKHITNTYTKQVKMIYIDPPYNTGSKRLTYKDNKSHSDWITFMYPRLYIAKQLLSDDGIIFISINNKELSQLKFLMDDIFGEKNFVSNFIRKNRNAPSQCAKHIANYHDYILCYTKNIDKLKINRKESDISKFKYTDEYVNLRGKFILDKLDRGCQQYSESLDYPLIIECGEFVEVFDGKKFKNTNITEKIEIWAGSTPEDKRWMFRWSRDKVRWGIDNGFIVFRKDKDGKWNVYSKEYELVDNKNKQRKKTMPYDNFIMDCNNELGSSEILNLFGSRIFEYPKPTALIKHLLKIGSYKDSIILDFFAGSGTTGDAVMQLNIEDGGNRKYILIQLPEPIDQKKNKTAYDFVKNKLCIENPTIFDITKERLIRSANKIKPDNKVLQKDLGFKIFKAI